MYCIENAVIYFMFLVDFNVDVMQYVVLFLLLLFDTISCNSYAHLEDAHTEMQQAYMLFFGCTTGCTRIRLLK
jgi:hypothetical protein